VSRQPARHARSKWEWGTPPSRSAERSQAAAEDVREPAKRAPARKDTRAWCRGKAGVEHVPVIAVDHTAPHFGTSPRCEWKALWDWKADAYHVGWTCPHHEICDVCKKVLRDRWTVPSRECPAYPGDPAQRAAVEASIPELERQQQERLARRRMPRKPVITGPQGFRRRREKA
jgi:hypothetical protein